MHHQHIHWLGHSSFRIEDGATQIYIDPWKLSSRQPQADYIFITHAHYDHFSPEDIAKITKGTTVFLAPKDVAYQMKGTVLAVAPDETHVVSDLRIRTTPAYNLGKKFHPKEKRWVGYIITLTRGQKIYHSGDTDAIPEMRTVQVDIAMLPCGGTYTMTGAEAAEMANVFKPQLLIPMHWGDIVGSTADAEKAKELFKGETAILVPER